MLEYALLLEVPKYANSKHFVYAQRVTDRIRLDPGGWSLGLGFEFSDLSLQFSQLTTYDYFLSDWAAGFHRYFWPSMIEFVSTGFSFLLNLRAKNDLTLKNETLAKFVTYNLCCLIQSMEASG